MFDLIGFIARAAIAFAPVHHAPAAPPTVPAVVEAAAPAAGAAGAPVQPPKPAELTADSAVGQVQNFYARIDHVDALFRQTVTDQKFGTSKTSDGRVYLLKPGKMRWDYQEKKKDKVDTKKSFISNGATLYIIEHENLQVIKKDIKQDLMPVAVSFLYGKGDLKSEFNAALDKTGKYGGKDEVVLLLTPKKPSAQYKSLILVASSTDFHVKQSIIIDSSNNTNQIRFYTPDFKKDVDAKIFEVDEKGEKLKNYRIVDADQQQQEKAGSGSAPAPAPAPKK